MVIIAKKYVLREKGYSYLVDMNGDMTGKPGQVVRVNKSASPGIPEVVTVKETVALKNGWLYAINTKGDLVGDDMTAFANNLQQSAAAKKKK